MRKVLVIDTSVLCVWLKVPGKETCGPSNALVSYKMVSEKIEEEKNSNVFEVIEKEFARPLTSMEYEIISAWLEDGVREDLIIEALREAVYSGVCNLRYIDKIIYEWGKKGIKTPQDVANNRLKFKEKQEKKEKLELFDYDWFEDGEDEEN